EVAAALPQHIDFATFSGKHHVSCAQALPGGRSKAPHAGFGEFVRIGFIGRKTHYIGSGHSAHFSATLYAAVSANRHQPGVLTSDISFGKLQVYQGPHVVSTVPMLRDAHAPHHNRMACLAKGL